MGSLPTSPVMFRADLDESELRRLRVACAKRDTTPRKLVTELLRDFVDLHEPEPVAAGPARKTTRRAERTPQ